MSRMNSAAQDSSAQNALRIGLIGPGRTRQGLGPFLARFAEKAGARVTALAGRDARRSLEAAAAMAQEFGHEVAAFDTMEELFTNEQLDAVIIASPIDTHVRALELAIAHRCHILCEKPLIWEGPGSAERASWFARDAERFGLHLWVNAQWPETLGAYDELHPGVREAAHESFEFLLAPISTGWQKVPDALPHALSLLQASCGSGVELEDAQIEDVRYVVHDSEQTRVSVYFCYQTHGRELDAHIELVHGLEVPRPAAYAFDGHWARREIALPDYSMLFKTGSTQGGGRSVAYADPTERLVHRFVTTLQQGAPARPAYAAAQRIAMLETLHHAWNAQFGESADPSPGRAGESS
jgi:hypothetical protein